jgi:formylglycine-generating enzyme required for sulfatase activity
MKFAWIPPGTFVMGSPEGEEGKDPNEGPQHKVEITRPFYLGIYPVTQAQWQAVMGSNPSCFAPGGVGKNFVRGLDTSDFPVEQVCWNDVVAFSKKLSEMPEERQAGRIYRVPTEAEFEYACRGGASSYQVFAFGNSLTTDQTNCSKTLGRTCKVGSYQPNGFGLHEMHGNVSAWCADWFDANYYANSPQQDPQGPSQGTRRVLRGGCWDRVPRGCRSAVRYGMEPWLMSYALGCRIVLVHVECLGPANDNPKPKGSIPYRQL